MMRGFWPVLVLAAIAGCTGQTGPQSASPERALLVAPGTRGLAVPGGTAGFETAPHVYMAIQPSADGPISVIFAIDEARNNTPTDDPAIRLTPEDGKCNPQELSRYAFPADNASRPIFSAIEAQRGITARELPNFMAMMVTSEMMRRGLVVEPQESQPQNVCTRKLWEQLIVSQTAG